MKTSDLTGDALDWAVGVAEGEQLTVRDRFPCVLNAGGRWNPSSNWSQGGPIIERERIAPSPEFRCAGYERPEGAWYWLAYVLGPSNVDGSFESSGPTPLVAAMRCYVASKLGAEVDVPAILPDSTC